MKIACFFIMINVLFGACFSSAQTNDSDLKIESEIQLLLNQVDFDIQQGNYESALEYLAETQRLNSTLTDPYIARSILNSMANIFYNTGQLDQAHRYYSELVGHDEMNKDHELLAVSLFNLGHVNASQENLELAGSNFERSLAISQEIGDESGSAFTLKAMGVNAQAQNDLDSARKQLNASLQGFRTVGDEKQTGTVYRHLGDVALASGDLEAAQLHYQKALPILAYYSFDTALLRAYRGLSQVYELRSDYENAFINYQAYSELLRQQLQQQNRETAQRLQVEFETQHFAEENGRLELMNQDQQMELQHRQVLLKMQYLFIALAAGIALLIGNMWWRSRQYAEELKVLATTDVLTGLLNRRAIIDVGNNEWHRAKRFDHNFSCLLIDIDHFKIINDTYGHAEGDKVLKEVSAAMKSTLRQTDSLGRFGGEEFLMLATENGPQEINVLAERIRTIIESGTYTAIPGKKITISIGVATMKDEDSLDDLIQHADIALYQAKNDGRNQVSVYKK